MKSILLGHDSGSGSAIHIPKKSFETHWHLIGGTGKGKTTALHTMLQQLMLDPTDAPCFFIIDRLGNFSDELLLWLSSSQFCKDSVRDRLVYIEPAREDVVLGFNPLLFDTDANAYYRVAHATDIILRAWESVNIEAMPRLARWTFNAFYAAAQLGLTIADCVHFLMPGSPHHAQLLGCLPDRLRIEWNELTGSRSSRVTEILDSSRNRLKPYFESSILRRMFGSSQNRLDALRFMREGKIVLVNLTARNRLSPQLANAIGALVIHEVLSTARSLPGNVRFPTYLVLDEFQNFVGPDLEAALPEVRQLGLKLLLSHQSFSQLERGQYDLTSMIFQAQSRLIFGVQGEDADLLAHELASITYDPRRIKDELFSRRQLVTGHRTVELASHSEAAAQSQQWRKDYGTSWSAAESFAHRRGELNDWTQTGSHNAGSSERSGEAGGDTRTRTTGTSESLVPVHEDFQELTTRTYVSFEEQKHEWASRVRNLSTGTGLLRLVDDPQLHDVAVKRSAHGYLSFDQQTLAKKFPGVLAAREALIEHNFASDLFVSPELIDRETERRIQTVLHPPIRLPPPADESDTESPDDPFV